MNWKIIGMLLALSVLVYGCSSVGAGNGKVYDKPRIASIDCDLAVVCYERGLPTAAFSCVHLNDVRAYNKLLSKYC